MSFFIVGKSSHASSAKRAGHLIRPTSPKSPVASASAFESVEGSDDEDNMTDNARLDSTYLHANGNAVILYLMMYFGVQNLKHLISFLYFLNLIYFFVLLRIKFPYSCQLFIMYFQLRCYITLPVYTKLNLKRLGS